jgi:hypothetical protein
MMQLDEKSQDLIDFYIWDGAVQRPIDLENLYQLDTEQTISFEIVFTAFIASIVHSTPRTGTILDSVAPVVAGGLLFITLIRKMALDNVFTSEKWLIGKSLSAIFYLTVFSTLYLSISFAERLAVVVGVNVYLLTAMILIIGTYGILIAYEITFEDFMLWSATAFYNQAFDEEKDYPRFYRIGLLMIARLSLRVSMVDYKEDHFAIRRIRKLDIGDEKQVSKLGLFILSSLLSLLILGLIALFAVPLAWILEMDLLIAGALSLALFLSFFSIVGLTQFVYARYGSAEIDDPGGYVSPLKTMVLSYSVILLHGGLLGMSVATI